MTVNYVDFGTEQLVFLVNAIYCLIVYVGSPEKPSSFVAD